jgi:hypothetical protein
MDPCATFFEDLARGSVAVGRFSKPPDPTRGGTIDFRVFTRYNDRYWHQDESQDAVSVDPGVSAWRQAWPPHATSKDWV